jgi:hypothetical protein
MVCSAHPAGDLPASDFSQLVNDPLDSYVQAVRNAVCSFLELPPDVEDFVNANFSAEWRSGILGLPGLGQGYLVRY